MVKPGIHLGEIGKLLEIMLIVKTALLLETTVVME
jgi:hypothetical protein